MRILLYICIGLSAIVAAISLTYLFVDAIRCYCFEARKPWYEHPTLRSFFLFLATFTGMLGGTELIATGLGRFGVMHSFTLAWKIANFVCCVALVRWLGRILSLQQTLPPDYARRLTWAVSAETFCERHFHTWWLPSVSVAAICGIISQLPTAIYFAAFTGTLSYRQMKFRFQRSAIPE